MDQTLPSAPSGKTQQILFDHHNKNLCVPGWNDQFLGIAKKKLSEKSANALNDMVRDLEFPQDDESLTDVMVYMAQAERGKDWPQSESDSRAHLFGLLLSAGGWEHKIDLTGRGLTDEHIKAICQGFTTDSSRHDDVSTLFSWVLLSAQKEESSQPALIGILSTILRNNTRCNKIELSNRKLEDHHIQVLCKVLGDALETNTIIQELGFFNCKTSIDSIACLEKLGQKNQGLVIEYDGIRAVD